MILNPTPPVGQGPAAPHPPILINPAPTVPIKPPQTINRPTGIPKAPPKKHKQSALDKWLAGDDTYQQQLADLNQELSAFKTNNTHQNQITNQNFNTTQRQMNTQANQDRLNQQYDFAGRGILHSGVFAKALGDYNTDFQTQMNNLIQGKTDTLQQSASDLADFIRQINLQRNSAKQDAIRRRQQELGI